MDFIGKYLLNLTDEFQIGFGPTHYHYTKNSGTDTTELNLTFNTPYISGSINPTQNYFGTNTSSVYYEIFRAVSLLQNEALSLQASLGYVTFSDEAKAGARNYLNYRFEMTKDVDGIALKIFYTDTNRKTLQNNVEFSPNDKGIGFSLYKIFD